MLRKRLTLIVIIIIYINIAGMQQNILIVINRLPPPSLVLEALKNLDEKALTIDQINAILRVYPAADVI